LESYLNITIRVAKAQAEAALASLRGEITGLNSAMRGGAGFNTATSVAGVDRLTGSIRSAGYALSATFTAPLLLAGRSLLSFSLANETAMADLKKVYGTNPLADYSKDVAALGKNFEALSNEYGVNQTEVIKIGAAWAAAGVQGAALARSVDNTLKTMVIGDINSAQATEALISIQGQYGASASDLTKILNDLNVVENTTAISMEGLITGFQRAAGAAANGGVTYRELAALLAAITPYAGTAAQAGNSLKTIISNLEAPSHAASEALKLVGINIADTGWKSATATDKLKEVAKAFENLSDAQKNVIARQLSGAFQVSRFDVLLRDIALSLDKTTAAQSRYGKAMAATIDPTVNAEVAQKELQTVLDSNPKKLQILGDMMKNNLADILVKLLPVIISIVAAVNSLVTWFSNLNPNVQKAVGIFLLLMAALGPVLLYLSALRDVARFGGDALFFFLKPLGLIPAALSLILAPARGAMALIGAIGALFTFSGRQATTGAVQVGASVAEMTASISANTEIIAANLFELINVIREQFAQMFLILRSIASAGFGTVAEEATVGMAATDTAVAAGLDLVVATFTTGGASIVAIWTATMGFIFNETVAGMGTINAEAATGMAALLGETETGLVLWNAEFAAAQLRNTVIINEGFLAQVSATRAGMLAIEGETAAGAAAASGGLLSGLARIPALILGFFIGLPGKIVGLLVGLPGMLLRVISGIAPAILTGGRAILAALTGPIGIAIAAVLLAVALFRKQIEEGWDSVVHWFQSGSNAVAGALAPLVNVFYDAISLVIKGFDALPQGVQSALMAVVNIVKSAAEAVYSLFSYLNPWAHHSPSLVENVTTGMQAVMAQFALLEDVSGPIDKAYNDIKRFGSAVAALEGHSNTITVNADVANIRKAGGGTGAVNAYLTETADVAALTARQAALNAAMKQQQAIVDKLDSGIKAYNQQLAAQNAILAQLQETQSAAQEGMSQAQSDLQKYQSYGIIGQKAMSDAIFESQMKEKDLQLQMMKIEDVTGPMQDVQSRMQALQGSMDALRGTSKALREAGASADITGVYDQQVTAMQKQYDDTKNQVAQYDQLNQQLTDAQRKTQELQLQDSLTYDPLTKQINDAATAMKELPFDQILKGVTDSKAALDQYTSQYDAATAAVKEQEEVIKSITAKRDALQATYDTENAKLDQLKKAYQDVGQAISDVNAELQKLTSSANNINQAAAAAAKAGKAGSNLDKNFAAAAGGNFPSAIGTGDIAGGKAGDIAGIDALTKQAQENLQNALGKLNPFGGIKKKWDEFTGWWTGTVTPGVSKLWRQVTGSGTVSGAASSAWDGLVRGFEAANKWLEPLWRQLSMLWALFKPDVVKFWHDLRDAFMQIGNDIGPKILPLLQSLGHLLQTLWPAVKLLAEIVGIVLVAALKIAADIFVNVLGTALHTIIAVLGDVIRIITDVVNFVTDIINGDWAAAWHDAVDFVEATFSLIGHIIEGAGKLVWGIVKGFVTGIVDFFKWLYDVLVGHSIIPDLINSIVDWFGGLPEKLLKALENLGKLLVNLFANAFDLVYNNMKAHWATILAWTVGLPVTLIAKLAGLGGKLASWAAGAFDSALNAFKTHWQLILSWATGIPVALIQAASSLAGKLANWAANGIDTALNAFRTHWQILLSWVTGLPHSIVTSLGNLGNLLYSVGGDLVGGIKRGIEDSWHTVVDSISGLASHLPSPIKKFFGIASPSKLMAKEIGGPLAQGIGVGFINEKPFILNQMKDISNAISAYKFATPVLPAIGTLPSITSFAGKMPAPTVPPPPPPPPPVSPPTTSASSEGKSTTLHVDKLVLPNITSGADAQELIDALEALANGSR